MSFQEDGPESSPSRKGVLVADDLIICVAPSWRREGSPVIF